jgi:hypothetical protein
MSERAILQRLAALCFCFHNFAEKILWVFCSGVQDA